MAQESGGKRRGDKRRAERAERAASSDVQPSDAVTRFAATRTGGQSPTAAASEGLATLREAMRLATENTGVPLSQMLREVIGAAREVVKAADPLGIIEEQGAELRAALAEIEDLKERIRGKTQPPRSESGADSWPLQ